MCSGGGNPLHADRGCEAYDGHRCNCIACHALPGQAGVASSFGPSLDKVGSRYNAGELRQWVTDARLIKPDTLMPPFGTLQGLNLPQPAQAILTPEQITQVVAALQTLLNAVDFKGRDLKAIGQPDPLICGAPSLRTT